MQDKFAADFADIAAAFQHAIIVVFRFFHNLPEVWSGDDLLQGVGLEVDCMDMLFDQGENESKGSAVFSDIHGMSKTAGMDAAVCSDI